MSPEAIIKDRDCVFDRPLSGEKVVASVDDGEVVLGIGLHLFVQFEPGEFVSHTLSPHDARELAYALLLGAERHGSRDRS